MENLVIALVSHSKAYKEHLERIDVLFKDSFKDLKLDKIQQYI